MALKRVTMKVSEDARTAVKEQSERLDKEYSEIVLLGMQLVGEIPAAIELVEEPASAPTKNSVVEGSDDRDPTLVKLIHLLDQNITHPQELQKQLGVDQADYMALWHAAMAEDLLVIHETHGALISPKGEEYAGLEPIDPPGGGS